MSSKKKIWVLGADIKRCFNTIAHEPLLNRIERFPAKDLIKRWLKTGYFKDQIFTQIQALHKEGLLAHYWLILPSIEWQHF